MSRAQRDKGARGELEVVSIWNGHGYDAWRTPNSGSFGHSPGDIRGVAGLHQEVKRQERLEMLRWIRQLESDVKPGDIPILVWRTSHMPWRVDMQLEDFIPIYKVATS